MNLEIRAAWVKQPNCMTRILSLHHRRTFVVNLCCWLLFIHKQNLSITMGHGLYQHKHIKCLFMDFIYITS